MRTITKQNIKSAQHIFSRKSDKPWAPTDSSNLFEESLTKLQKLYEKDKDVLSTITHRGLWLQQLLASGNVPVEDIDDIFVRHTLLILITRIIMKDELVTEGFVKWVSEECEEIRSLREIIEQYEWRHSIDILRSLYIHFIPKKHRKLFGEYYTPDWLAEHICQKVIDERYIKLQLKNFREGKKIHGVLDPFCGSGTFLVHGITRMLNSEALQESKLSKHQTNQFISEMIHGIDIHPVAVEMARANVKRLLPGINQINVYQGDSLLLSDDEISRKVTTPKSARDELTSIVGLNESMTKPNIRPTNQTLKAGRIVSNPPWIAPGDSSKLEEKRDNENCKKYEFVCWWQSIRKT